jgi:hypothetical protein
MERFRLVLFAIAAAVGAGACRGASAQGDCEQIYQAHARLVETMQRCQYDMNRAMAEMQRLAPQGIMPPGAPCANLMPQWIAQLRYIEAQMGHCQGDMRSLCEQQGYPRGCEAYRPD